jgi:hypothetical protein
VGRIVEIGRRYGLEMPPLEAAREEKERADALRAELDAGRPGGSGERRGRWRGTFGG